VGFLEDLLKIRELPELNDSHFPDHEQRLYRSFLDRMANKGVTLPILFGEKFKSIILLKKNPQILDAIKKALEKYHEQNLNKNKNKFETVQIQGTELLEKIPLQYFIPESSILNVITKRVQKKHSIRELLYELFPLYKDDYVHYSLKFHGKEISSGEGMMENCFIPTEVIEKFNIGDSQLQMLTLNISMSGFGDNRRRHEESSFIFDTDLAKKQMVDKEVQFDLFKRKLTNEQIIERAKLFGVTLTEVNDQTEDFLKEQLVPSDFGAKQITDISSVHLRFHQDEPNEDLLKFKGNLNLELVKMEEWLSRENADGFNGHY